MTVQNRTVQKSDFRPSSFQNDDKIVYLILFFPELPLGERKSQIQFPQSRIKLIFAHFDICFAGNVDVVTYH